MEPIVGIDLGTTNSEVAYIFNGNAEIIKLADDGIMPSCVGLDPEGKLIVGSQAKNQAAIAPERTILSIKRQMGTDTQVVLGDQSYSPQEISALILKELKRRAEKAIGNPVNKAVITVPAYFTDAQRQATREAGTIAGLEVVRIINEPTAAALAYEKKNDENKTVLVYDLGGGTFDVSIVRIENSVVEVLASTGDNHLGGDDFDNKISEMIADRIEKEHSVSVTHDKAMMARLKNAAEIAKIHLSSSAFADIELDHIVDAKNNTVHFKHSLSVRDFEDLIKPEINQTMDAVSKALDDAKLTPAMIDKIVLVGGSTRIPFVAENLFAKLGKEPHGEVDPDLCVGLGASIQAAREMGVETSTVLVDITPYTFGTSCFGELDGVPSPFLYVPIIRRNSKLPVSKSDVFYTMAHCQEEVEVKIYQGEAINATNNLLIGDYMMHLSGNLPEGSPVTFKYDLDINGILNVEAVERKTGKKLKVTIENAFEASSVETVEASRDKLNAIWETDDITIPDTGDVADTLPENIASVLRDAKEKLDDAPEEDRDDIINLIEDIGAAIAAKNMAKAEELAESLDDILFYIG